MSPSVSLENNQAKLTNDIIRQKKETIVEPDKILLKTERESI